jgi:single-strand DNA-binding protein
VFFDGKLLLGGFRVGEREKFIFTSQTNRRSIMISMNNVQILGKVTIPPRIRTVKKSGVKVGEMSVGLPENFRKENGEWANRMHFVEVVLWEDLAEYAETKLGKGDGVLVQGALQFEQWEAKDGGKRSKLKVKALRVQYVPQPVYQENAAG